MVSPYQNRPQRSFWKSAVAGVSEALPELYNKRFTITRKDRIAAAGSCFAQHILTNLVSRKYNIIDVEPPPQGLSLERARSFGYGIYSARYGNIYTARQMLQLAQECFGLFEPTDVVWTKNSRYYDGLRPSVEPEGLDSAEEVLAHRADHVRRVRQMLTTADVLIFTLGLTETWVHTASGTVYPTAPETIAGQYNPEIHSFKNFSVAEVIEDLTALRALLKSYNPKIRFLLTVSPVPLAATASDDHVLVATTHSKSVLRAAAGAVYQEFEDIDYFPSYEIITNPFAGRMNYEADLRTVKPKSVRRVMRTFFDAHQPTAVDRETRPSKTPKAAERGIIEKRKSAREIEDDIVCEEKLLEAFGQ